MRAESEASRLYAKVGELRETLAKREAELEAARAELAEAAVARAETETLASRVAPLETQVAALTKERLRDARGDGGEGQTVRGGAAL